MIGIVGAAGAVGRATERQLAVWQAPPLRLGVRTMGQLPGAEHEVATVQIEDELSLRKFCRGCRIVVNCAGPSSTIGARVALAAHDEGADYVDPAGDERLVRETASFWIDGRRGVLGSGWMPGLSEWLPRMLVHRGLHRIEAITLWIGGRGRFTRTAALDYLTGVAGTRSNQPARRIATDDLPPSWFPSTTTVVAYSAPEIERLARATDASVRSYSVFDGPHVVSALQRLGAQTPTLDAAIELHRAAELDGFGRTPYQLAVVRADGDCNGVRARQFLVMRGRDASELTGTMTALATLAIVRGEVGPGLHHAAEVLDPLAGFARLRTAVAVEQLDVIDRSEPDEAQYEQGAL